MQFDRLNRLIHRFVWIARQGVPRYTDWLARVIAETVDDKEEEQVFVGAAEVAPAVELAPDEWVDDHEAIQVGDTLKADLIRGCRTDTTSVYQSVPIKAIYSHLTNPDEEVDSKTVAVAKRFLLRNGLLRFQSVSGSRIVVPVVVSTVLVPDLEGGAQGLRASILYIHHNKFLHPGAFRLYQTVSKTWFWPKLASDIRRYLSSCLVCSMRLPTRGESGNSELSSATLPALVLFDQIMIDYFSLDDRNVLLVIDCYSHFAFSQTVEVADARSTALVLFDVMSFIGFPSVILCDNGSHFANETVAVEMSKLLGFKMSFSSPYHPRRNGLVETLVKEIKASLKSGIIEMKHGLDTGEASRDFPFWLKIATLNHNRSPFAYYDISPYEIVFGRPIREVDNPPDTADIVDPVKSLRECWRYVRGDRYAFLQDRHSVNVRQAASFEPGDKVIWRVGPNISIEVLQTKIGSSTWALQSGATAPEDQLRRFVNVAEDLQVAQVSQPTLYSPGDIVLVRSLPGEGDHDVDECINVGRVISVDGNRVMVEDYFCNERDQWFSHGPEYVTVYHSDALLRTIELTKQQRISRRELKQVGQL